MDLNQREILNMTVKQLKRSVEAIDHEFGKNFAKDNSELVGSFLIALSNNNLAASLYSELNNITKTIERHS